MPLKYWTFTTAKPEGYFVGLQLPPCTSDLDQRIYPSGPFFNFDCGLTSVGWTTVANEGVGSHVYTFRGQATQGAPTLPSAELLARLYCLFIVSVLPNEALPELADELGDLGSRHMKSVRKKPPELTSPTRLKAKVGKAVARPEIQLDTE
jgi:hypothetical protein